MILKKVSNSDFALEGRMSRLASVVKYNVEETRHILIFLLYFQIKQVGLQPLGVMIFKMK